MIDRSSDNSRRMAMHLSPDDPHDAWDSLAVLALAMAASREWERFKRASESPASGRRRPPGRARKRNGHAMPARRSARSRRRTKIKSG
jgi:hypothetical protein